ncbi:hypothetical protein LZ30DRAFT_114852 [Colletotrichum cereale]|nr:hypothetical protein LZ30DRAFT_114852 [Colletotrichum cereale]
MSCDVHAANPAPPIHFLTGWSSLPMAGALRGEREREHHACALGLRMRGFLPAAGARPIARYTNPSGRTGFGKQRDLWAAGANSSQQAAAGAGADHGRERKRARWMGAWGGGIGGHGGWFSRVDYCASLHPRDASTRPDPWEDAGRKQGQSSRWAYQRGQRRGKAVRSSSSSIWPTPAFASLRDGIPHSASRVLTVTNLAEILRLTTADADTDDVHMSRGSRSVVETQRRVGRQGGGGPVFSTRCALSPTTSTFPNLEMERGGGR